MPSSEGQGSVSDRRSGNGRSRKDDPRPWAEGRVGRLEHDVIDGLHPSTQVLSRTLAVAFDEAYDLALRKQESYGPYNILRSPGGALNGLRVRLSDKQARWNHMLDTGNADRVNESLRETFMDALNYCAFAVLILDGTFPEQEPAQ